MSTRLPLSRTPEHGQALVLGLLIVSVAAVSMVMLYNLGQTVEARIRLTHAADAAAFSGALEQARALNAIAYVNRTQIAHQVAMAHLVTLAAAAQYSRTLQRQRIRGNPPASLIAMMFGPDMGLAYRSAQALPDAESRLASAFAQHDRVVHQVLEAASAAAMSGLPASRERIMNKVLYANLPDLGLTDAARGRSLAMHLLSDAWPGFVERNLATRKSGLRPAVEQAVDRYGFLKKRNKTRRNPWPVSHRCPLFRHELRRRGSTWMGPDGRWGALDTQSFHALRSNRWIGCYFREYAMGWGTVQGLKSQAPGDIDYVDEPPVDFSNADFWRWVEQSTSWDIFNGVTNPMANSYAMAARQRWRGRGLPAYREIAATHLRTPLRFAVGVRLTGEALKTTDANSALASPVGRFRYAALGRAGTVTVTSAAETYFLRPEPRADGRDELATLFRPYWQARLSAVLPGEVVLARRQP